MRRERAGPVAGVVLAAGASTRMGRNKLFLRLDGESLLRRAVGRAAAAGLDPVLVVVGHEADRAVAELSGLPCRTAVNPDYESGLSSSIRVGLAAVPAEACAAIVLLADMPFVTDRMIASLVERYRGSSAPLVVSDYAGVQAPPTLYDRSLFGELGEIEGEGCGRRVARRHASEATALAWPAAALTDLDRPEDYEKVKSELEAREKQCAPTS
ncbi:MAG: nucleotidyltransferase family protein [Thermoanaerobaculia bacterium]